MNPLGVWDTAAQEAARVGLFALLFVALLFWVLSENKKREERMAAESRQREERLIAESKQREDRLLAESKQREELYAEREDRYLAIIQTLGEEVKERLAKLENQIQVATHNAGGPSRIAGGGD